MIRKNTFQQYLKLTSENYHLPKEELRVAIFGDLLASHS
jgi:hypothetical protein